MNATATKAIAIIIVMIIFIVAAVMISTALTNWVFEPVTDPNWSPDILVEVLSR